MILVRRFLYVIFFVQVGLLLIVLPWWPAFWEHNYFALAWPPLRTVLTNNFVRGAVSGLGFVNLFAGFADLAVLFTARERNEMSLDESARRP
ncbi:MAG TPA: hypothetical protein VKD69_22665 [Vicinamibacterales bacterium]|nr:hypothetical protein [Vicinamibacterales bacterium]